MAIYLSRQKSSGTATPITPSNASPVALAADNAVKPTTSGYAIASYDSVTPSSSPESVSSGDIVKIGGSGVIVDAVPPTPTSITPSNASPVALTANTPVTPTANGVAVESVTNITLSDDTSIVALSENTPVSPNSSGYAIKKYYSASPSDTSPASVLQIRFYRPTYSGYLYRSKCGIDFSNPDLISQANISSNSSRSITVTQKPRFICVLEVRNSDSTGRSYSAFYDVANNKYTVANYSGDGYTNTKAASGMSPYITSVTSSSVTISNPNAATVRSHVLIWY